MNHLSWLIYFAGLCDNLRDVVAVAIGLTGLGVVACLLQGVILRDNGDRYSDEYKQGVRLQKTALIRGSAAVIILSVMLAIMPDKQTLYLIAGSEAGEQAVATPEFAKVRVIINNWLDKEAAPADKK